MSNNKQTNNNHEVWVTCRSCGSEFDYRASVYCNKCATQHTLNIFDFMQFTKDYRIRRLTPIECERLQTVPDNYTCGVSDTQRYKMLGNG